MNEPSESTHYQVELTSRQVLTALVVLLVCLFAAFFAGVWIGRNAEADQAALELARVDPVTGAGERFDFFSRTKAPGAEGGEAAADPSSSALDDSELGDPEPLDESAFGPDPDDEELESADIAESGASADREALFEDDPEADLPPPEEMGRGGRRRRAAARANEAAAAGADDPTESPADPEAAPASVPPPSPTTAPVAAPPARAAARDESGFFIQVLATADRAKAETLIGRLVDADFNAFLAPSEEGGRTIYRVRVGPFSDRALATRQAAELKTRWGLDSWIPPGAP